MAAIRSAPAQHINVENVLGIGALRCSQIDESGVPARARLHERECIQEFHRLRAKQKRKGRLSVEESQRPSELFEIFHPLRVDGRYMVRERLEVPVHRRGTLSLPTGVEDVEILWMGLWSITVAAETRLVRGTQITLFIGGPHGKILYRFKGVIARVALSERRATILIRLPIDQH